ncbi:MAG: putative lipoprotein [Verrucomicrobiales bacterium]|nr:putative lipoprotein [Verrucomicrobiales bacterium]
MKHKFRMTARKKINVILAILPLLVFLTACRTVPRLAPVDVTTKDWHVQQGQAIWKTSKSAPELAGDLFIATNEQNGRTLVQFIKTPIPFVIAQTTTNSWQIEIPVQKKFYSGRGHPPRRLAWFFVPKVLEGGTPPKPWTFEKHGENWKLENKSRGEVIEGFLESAATK